MLVLSPQGLYCPMGNFHIDPKGRVEHAVITHAHADHARRGAQNYYCTKSGEGLLRARVGKNIRAQSYGFGEPFQIGSIKLSFHPAGHILGSAQVRLESASEVWVASGDYKRESDPTCEPFEVVKCDVFVTEATFGTPGFQWQRNQDIGREIFEWWQENAGLGFNSLLFAYSLGKTQRVLGLLHPHTTESIYCHSAAREINACYRQENIKLAPTICLESLAPETRLQGALVIAPQMFLKSPQASILGKRFRTAFASGWMAKDQGRDPNHRGFVLSDHADWKDLVRTVQDTEAKKIYVQHRGTGALVKHLRGLGLEAYPESELAPKVANQMSLF